MGEKSNAVVRLYHGSNAAIEKPLVSFNTGFADLGKGFYLTDSLDAAKGWALTRARRTGEGTATVSIFELDKGSVPWVEVGADGLAVPDGGVGSVFGLCFAESPEGVVAWANYIKACRQGRTEVGELGSPAIVRAWIATEEVEMACSGFVDAEDLGEFVNPQDLTVQYCLLSQELIDRALIYAGKVESCE